MLAIQTFSKNIFHALHNHKTTIVLLTALYFLLNIFIIINWGIYWDDWWLISLNDNDLFEMFRQSGNPNTAFFHLLFRKSFSPIAFYKTAQFFCGYITIISIYYIFKKEFFKDKYLSFWATAFIIAIPLNFAKGTLICLPNNMYLAIFYFIFALLLFAKDKIIIRLIANMLFFITFFTPSIISFYTIFLGINYLHNFTNNHFISLKKLKIFFKSNLDFILLPIFFVAFKYLIIPLPYGEYKGYNSINLSSRSFSQTVLAFFTILKKIIFPLSTNFEYLFILISFSIIVIALIMIRRKIVYFDKRSFILKESGFIKIIIFCILSIFCAIFPYILIGRAGSNFGTEWQDRDTLLLPFGLSLFFIIIILFLLSSQYLINHNRLRSFLAIVCPLTLLINFIFSSFHGQLQLLRDSIKQDAILNFMKSESEMSNNFTFAFEDKCPELNIYNRFYRSYELNGMSQSVFGDQKRLFITKTPLKDSCPIPGRVNGICKDWKRSELDKIISVDRQQNEDFTFFKTVTLSFLRYINRGLYNEKIRRVFSIKLNGRN